MKNRFLWKVSQPDRVLTQQLADGLRVPRPVAHLLAQRGVSSLAEGTDFLSHDPARISDPLSLTDMQRAVTRIREALERDEHIMVFGDYDVDGICATAILRHAFARLGFTKCSYGMPNRLTEGYGLSEDRVAWAKEQGVGLLVTVDNGISAIGPARVARELGIDLIVTDHHQLGDELPDAFAIVNPKRDGESHPSYHACGASLAAMLAYALTGSWEDLDLAAFGLVADIVPLRGENRVMVGLGLESMRQHARPGLKALCRVSKLSIAEVQSEHIAFQLAPRINAGGRLGDGLAGLELLMTDDESAAREIAESLDAANLERREIERQMSDEAIAEFEQNGKDKRSIVLARRGWHPGVVGIVAARLMHRYYLPTILIAVDEAGVGRGSARSISELDIVPCIGECKHLLQKFGGHRAAAGLTIEEQHLGEFVRLFEQSVRSKLPDEALSPTLAIDGQVALGEVDSAFVSILERLQPFGHENPSPIFCTYGAEVMPHSLRELRGGHIKLTLRSENRVHPAIGFSMESFLPELRAATHVDIAFTPKFNTWQGESTVQLQLKDIKPSS